MLSKYSQLFEKDSPWYDRAKAFGERVCEFSQFFLQVKGSQKMVAENKLRVLYHDPCHLRFSRQGREIPRTLLDSVENTIRVEPEDGAHCCGQGGLFHLAYEELSDQIFQKSYAAALPESPDIVVTSCSGCLMQWQTGLAARKSSVRAVHLAVFLSNCLLSGLGREKKNMFPVENLRKLLFLPKGIAKNDWLKSILKFRLKLAKNEHQKRT
jgi:glycolate oxidase iron-sulfur subunit